MLLLLPLLALGTCGIASLWRCEPSLDWLVSVLLKAPGVGRGWVVGGWLVVGRLHLTAVWPWKQKPWQPAGLMKIEALA